MQYTDTASAGNGGVATASANGGAVGIGDVNSGGNAGSAIGIGDTVGTVAADGGTMANSTTLSVSANGGTAIADASGGNYNLPGRCLATTSGESGYPLSPDVLCLVRWAKTTVSPVSRA
jgi:hypothetical protein